MLFVTILLSALRVNWQEKANFQALSAYFIFGIMKMKWQALLLAIKKVFILKFKMHVSLLLLHTKI